MVNKCLEPLLEGLFPSRCVLCGLPSHRALPLCRGCEGDLVPNRPACPRCALPQARPLPPGIACGACQRRPPPFAAALAPWIYEEQLAFIIGRWKFGGERRLAPLLAHLFLARARGQLYPPDLLLPTPLHWGRRFRRGFNQAEDLCAALVRGGLPAKLAGRSLARRSRATPAQSALDASSRERNLRDAFTAIRRCDNLRIAIVDDVLTTGATTGALARALLSAGAAHVEVWCLARTPAPGS